jgi:hypothetical protein
MASDQPVLQCSACGAPLQAGSTSCQYCGAQLARAPGGAPAVSAPTGWGGAPSGPAPGTSPVIEPMRAAVCRAHGLYEQQYAYVSPAQRGQFAQKLGGMLLAVSNQVLAQDGRPIQVNYLHGASPDDTRRVYQSLVAQVGQANLVARKGDVVVEIITNDARDREAVSHAIQPEETNQKKKGWW